MKKTNPYRYERLSNENVYHLKELYQLVFKKNVSVEFLRKKYDTEYIGKSFLGHIAFDHHRPVAYGGFVPFRIRYKDTIEVGAQSVDSMALSEVNGKGVFTQIYWMNEELLKSEGIHFGYGFGNQNSTPVFIHKFQWISNQQMTAFMIPVKAIPSGKVLNKLGRHKQYHKKIITVLEPYRVKKIPINPFSLGDWGYTVYDKDFFEYKSFQQNYVIKINGIMVWLKASHVLSIGQIEDCSKEDFLLVIEKLKSISRAIGLNKVFLQYSEHAPQITYLKEKFVFVPASPICFKSFKSSIPLDKILFSNGDIDTF